MPRPRIGAPPILSLFAAVDGATELVGRDDGVSYRLQYIRCGKPTCWCVDKPGHGPYWYACWNDGDKTRSIYIGKKFREIQRPSGPRSKKR